MLFHEFHRGEGWGKVEKWSFKLGFSVYILPRLNRQITNSTYVEDGFYLNPDHSATNMFAGVLNLRDGPYYKHGALPCFPVTCELWTSKFNLYIVVFPDMPSTVITLRTSIHRQIKWIKVQIWSFDLLGLQFRKLCFLLGFIWQQWKILIIIVF